MPTEPGLAHEDGTVVILEDGVGFPLTLTCDGVTLGGTSRDPACPGLVVGRRTNDDSGGWIEPARADVQEAVDFVVAARTIASGPTARITLQDAGGAVAGHAELTLSEGAKGFVVADVTFFEEDGAPLDERDLGFVGFVGLCLDVGVGENAVHIVVGGEHFDCLRAGRVRGTLTELPELRGKRITDNVAAHAA